MGRMDLVWSCTSYCAIYLLFSLEKERLNLDKYDKIFTQNG